MLKLLKSYPVHFITMAGLSVGGFIALKSGAPTVGAALYAGVLIMGLISELVTIR